MFKDLPQNHWAKSSIERVAKMGLMSGYEDGTFRADNQITRAEIASVIDRLLFRDGLFDDIIHIVMPAVVCIQAAQSLGSGACITRTTNFSYIITNHHVVKNSIDQHKKDVLLVEDDEKKFAGEILIADMYNDLALIKTMKRLPTLKISSKPIQQGQPVAVVGAPAGLIESVSVGIVSNVNRNEDKWFQTDAPVNPGNSGGPIINEHGEIVGIAVAKLAGYGFEGIGYGIKVEVVNKFLEQVKNKII